MLLLLLLYSTIWAGRIQVPCMASLLRVAMFDDTGSLKQLNPTIVNHLSKQSINILVCVFVISARCDRWETFTHFQRLTVYCRITSRILRRSHPWFKRLNTIKILGFLGCLLLLISYFLFQEATQRAEPIGTQLITRWMRADWLIEIINTWQWSMQSRSFPWVFIPPVSLFSFFLPFFLWNLHLTFERWNGSRVSYIALYIFSLVSTYYVHKFNLSSAYCLYIRTRWKWKDGARTNSDQVVHLLPVAKLFLEKCHHFRLGIAPNHIQHESIDPFQPIKKGKSCPCRSFHFTYPFSGPSFERL